MGDITMNLRKYLVFDDIVIQCHDFPDADTIASGYAIYTYLTGHGKKPRLIYSGTAEISKSNLTILINSLEIPLEYVKALDHKPQLLITADCFYDAKNITHFDAERYAGIDHHAVSHEKNEYDLVCLCGSCSSIIADLLVKEGFDPKDINNRKTVTALYYGLYTDTGGTAEISSPFDRDLRDWSEYCDHTLLSRMIHSNISLEELKIAGRAFENTVYNKKHRYSVVRTEECDPNILGFISDNVLDVCGVDLCVVYSVLKHGIKLSIRSCAENIRASEVAEYLANGGGDDKRAGGFIPQSDDLSSFEQITGFILEKLNEFYESFDVEDTDTIDLTRFELKNYRRLDRVKGYIRVSDITGDTEGQTVFIRTSETDLYLRADKDIYLMVEEDGMIYPIKADRFDAIYSEAPEYSFGISGKYKPNIIIKETGRRRDLSPYIRPCVSKKTDIPVRAAILKRCLKLYTDWSDDRYMTGKPGDYLVVRDTDGKDIYISPASKFRNSFGLAD
ncbi:MAG: DHH family phosphoesterase [Ruminiclostridium sp.]|nr:DHH family phosphoesterase [Ruminiclostridium sp.]